MKTLLTILFISVISVKGQMNLKSINRHLTDWNDCVARSQIIKVNDGFFIRDMSYRKDVSGNDSAWRSYYAKRLSGLEMIDSAFATPYTEFHPTCECCSEWIKEIGQKTVLIYSYKPLLDYYKDSATTAAIKDHVKELQREIDELLKKAIDCR